MASPNLSYSGDSNWTHMGYNQSGGYYGDGVYEFDMGSRVRTLFRQPHRVVALCLGALAITLNILSIMAILRTRRLLTSHYRFIVSLAVGDILVGVTVTGHLINHVVNPRYPLGEGPWRARIQAQCMFNVIKALNTTSLIITLLNLMAMAIDHFLAILKPLHYPTLMNRGRATVLIIVLWLLALLCGFSDFMSGYPKYPRYMKIYNYCEFVYLTKYQEEYPLLAIAVICLLVMCVTYIRMFCAIRSRPNMGGPMRQELARNKKALFTTLLILTTFIVCWMPSCLFQIVLIIQVHVDREALASSAMLLSKVDQYLYDLLLLNAIFDPVIYAVRMREVQFGYRKLFGICVRRFRKENRFNTDSTRSTLIMDDRKTTQYKLQTKTSG